jgi:hypothetical protein
MAALIQSPAKCEVRSVIWFPNAKVERPAEIHKQIVAVCGDFMNRQNVTKWCREKLQRRTHPFRFVVVNILGIQRVNNFLCPNFLSQLHELWS